MIKLPNTKTSRLYLSLSSFYFFFFIALGAFLPYWSLYLRSLGFNSIEIGELLAIVMGSKLISPYLLGWLSDHLQKRLVIIQISILLSIVAFTGVFPFKSYWWFAGVMAVFGFFWNASLPLFESLTLSHLEGDTDRYGHIRLWGSIGFIVIVVLLPIVISEDRISQLPLFVLGLLMLSGIITFFLKDKVTGSHLDFDISFGSVLKKPIVIAFLVVCALQTLSHGAYYTFFSIYLEDHEYSRNIIGVMWALGVIAEVLLFIVVHKMLKGIGVCKLFVISLFITVIRWLLLAVGVESLVLLVLIQLLHAASFGLFHATAISLTNQLFSGRLHARGQALYAGLSFGLGGALGNWLSGYSWEIMGSSKTFLASAFIALVGAIIATFFIKDKYLPAYENR